MKNQVTHSEHTTKKSLIKDLDTGQMVILEGFTIGERIGIVIYLDRKRGIMLDEGTHISELTLVTPLPLGTTVTVVTS